MGIEQRGNLRLYCLSIVLLTQICPIDTWPWDTLKTGIRRKVLLNNYILP